MIARLVTDKLRTSLKGGEEPLDFLTLIRGLGRILKAALDLMVELDSLLVAENQRRAALYNDREDKTLFLGQRITGVRRLVNGHFVKPDLARLGLEGRTAREPVALLRLRRQLAWFSARAPRPGLVRGRRRDGRMAGVSRDFAPTHSGSS